MSILSSYIQLICCCCCCCCCESICTDYCDIEKMMLMIRKSGVAKFRVNVWMIEWVSEWVFMECLYVCVSKYVCWNASVRARWKIAQIVWLIDGFFVCLCIIPVAQRCLSSPFLLLSFTSTFALLCIHRFLCTKRFFRTHVVRLHEIISNSWVQSNQSWIDQDYKCKKYRERERN